MICCQLRRHRFVCFLHNPLQGVKKLRAAEAAVDGLQQQVVELCRSDMLSKAREQHDRDLAVTKEQHAAALLRLHQKVDSTCQALSEQVRRVAGSIPLPQRRACRVNWADVPIVGPRSTLLRA